MAGAESPGTRRRLATRAGEQDGAGGCRWPKRPTTGRPKAEQIRRTGARVAVTSCDNCRHQLTDLSEHCGLGIEVKNLAEVTAEALV